MKKLSGCESSHDHIFKKLLRTMRITLFLTLAGILQTFAVNSFSQAQTISLNMSRARIVEVLNEIESQSQFRFIYSPNTFNVDDRITVSVNDQKIDDVLQQIFSGTHVNYQKFDKQIVLSSEPVVSNQTRTITGKVTDQSGQPLPGVTVVLKGTTIGTITNTEGRYTISNIPANASLAFSFVGMRVQEIPVAGKAEINVKMVEEAIGIEEVVAIGYGTQTKRDISGSVANISEKNFNKGINTTAVDLLKGKVAGLSITQGSGDITKEQTIRLRGTSSLTGSSEPFIVIDGVPGLSMNSVASQDIESISILKDASAAAIYGSRSASGVILITTKKGKKDVPIVEYDGFVAVSDVTNIPDVLTAKEWRDYAAEKELNVTGLDKGADTDWFGAIMRTGVSHNHNLSLSGGGQNSNYRASINYMDQKGVVKDNFLERYNARIIFNQKALNNMLDLSFTGSLTIRDYSPTETRNFILAYNMIPVVPIKNEDGTWFDSSEYDQGNPVRNIRYNERLNKNSLFYGNIKADLHLFEGFTVSLNLFKQRMSNDSGEYLNSQTERGRSDLGLAKRENWTKDKNLLETTLNYTKTIHHHSFNLLAGYSYEDNYHQNFGAQNRQFVTDFFSYNNLGAGEDLRSSDVWSGKNMNKLISFFGRVNYSFKERYILTLTLRDDGSSKFGKNHKWATFPSVSGAWRISEESFLKNANFIDEFKLRAGYGVSGNQEGLDPYTSLQLYGTSGRYYDNGKWYSAYQISQNANPDLKWEETSMFNVGLDFSLFGGRLNGTAEYYDKNTDDLLYNYSVPVPPNLYPTTVANVGSMSNKGVELFVNSDIVRKNDLRWTVSVNLAHNKNVIKELSNDIYSTNAIYTGSAYIRGGSYNTTHIVEEGREVGTFYGWLSKGLDENGKYIMDDMVDGKAGLTNEDRTYIGSAQPKLTYGIANAVAWKRWDLSFFFRGVYGNDLLNLSKMSYATTQWLPGANVLREALTNGLTDNPKYSSYYIEKGSFLRLDNASLGYNFSVAKLKFIQRMRVYVIGQNLITFTSYTGLDPEIEMSGLDPGIEGREYYPKSRTWLIGLNISF